MNPGVEVRDVPPGQNPGCSNAPRAVRICSRGQETSAVAAHLGGRLPGRGSGKPSTTEEHSSAAGKASAIFSLNSEVFYLELGMVALFVVKHGKHLSFISMTELLCILMTVPRAC